MASQRGNMPNARKEKDKEKANTKKGKQAKTENNEGWQEVEGKSAAKTTHVIDDGRMSITNCFNVLNKQSENQ